ncbi:MAG TPA: glycine zipper domain-containing protein [Flavisolibacter sp.]|nr:glycine zipper domain-containing protein [Flavisolibacter sp.]
MKKILFALSTVAIMASCSNDNPRTAAAETKIITPVDTAGLAQFQTWRAQNELAATQQAQQNLVAEQPVKEVVKERVVYVDRPAPKRKASTTKRSSSSGANNSSGGGSGSSTSTSENTAKKKEGWSKAAKGAVIGGVGGAVIGGVVNKRNRGAGAVIGGVLGAGAGYGIGRSKDKKDGRY